MRILQRSVLSVLLLAAVPLRASPVGAIVQSWHYDSVQRTLTLQVVNTSSKEITAYSLSIIVTYADGTINRSELSEDFLPAMISASESESVRQQEGNGAFAPGASREKVIPNTNTNEITNVTASVGVVIYADRKADVQDERAFNRLLAMRKGSALAAQQVTEVLAGILADSTISDPAAAAEAELKRLADGSGPTRSSNDTDPKAYAKIHLREVSQNIQRASNRNEFVRQLVKQEKDTATTATLHAQVVKEGEQ